MPNVPTFDEAGFPGVDIMSIWGLHAPAATPLPISRQLRDMVVEVMRTPAVNARMAELGYEVVGLTPEEHQAETKRLVAFWLEVGTKIKLTVD
jgi:tripartite-type tricarboxylate transporter receptor subunit TctC